MNTMSVSFAVAPQLTMNPLAQNVALASGAIGMLICLIIGWRMSLKHKTPLPFLFPIAGACDVVLEPVICFLFHRFMTAGLSNAFLWRTFAVLFVFAQLFEIAPVNYGLWYHYGYHPFRFGEQGEPLFFPVVNLVPAFLGFLLIIKYRHLLAGWKSLLIIPLTQAAAYMGHLGAGFPYYNVINSSVSETMVQWACIASVLLALAFIAAINQALVETSRQRNTSH